VEGTPLASERISWTLAFFGVGHALLHRLGQLAAGATMLNAIDLHDTLLVQFPQSRLRLPPAQTGGLDKRADIPGDLLVPFQTAIQISSDLEFGSAQAPK
jgi:hypothetical protein